jgi:hypothetical protein
MKGSGGPVDMLSRFMELAAAFDEHRRWWEGARFFRHAAASLITTPGAPSQVARGVVEAARHLQRHAGWFGPLNGDARFLVAALLVREGADATRFCEVMDRGREALRRVGVRRGGLPPVFAVLLLWLGGARREVTQTLARRTRDVLDAMREHHPWLTGANDLPAAAALALRGGPIHGQMHRIERIYRGLRDAGFAASDRLQTTSHLLFFVPTPDETAVRRFSRLHERFRSRGVAMWESDQDELAVLCMLDRSAHEIVEIVLAHRERVRSLRPRPDVSESFSLACATTFFAFAGPAAEELADVGVMVNLQQLVAAQAAVGATHAATVAAVT